MKILYFIEIRAKAKNEKGKILKDYLVHTNKKEALKTAKIYKKWGKDLIDITILKMKRIDGWRYSK